MYVSRHLVHDMSLKHAERLHVVACALTGKLVRLLSLGTGCHFEPERNRHACHKGSGARQGDSAATRGGERRAMRW